MQYVPFASEIEIPFYASLANHKINHDKLDDSARKVLGLYEIRPADAKEHSCRMQIHGNALTNDEISPGAYRAEGTIKNVNTIEDYRNIDKMAMLHQAGQTIWDAINDGTIYSCPSLLNSFLILSFAELKKYKFYYWFAFPALVMEPSWTTVSDPGASPNSVPYKKLDSAETCSLVEAVQGWRLQVDSRQHGFFLAKKNRRINQKFKYDDSDDADSPLRAPAAVAPAPAPAPTTKLGYQWEVASLSAYETGFFEGQYSDDCYIAFADPSNYTEDPGPAAPGWPLRNLLVLVRQKWQRDRVQILCYRETPTRPDAARSIIFDMQVSTQAPRKRLGTGTSTGTDTDKGKGKAPITSDQPTTPSSSSFNPHPLPKVVGWERNAQGKLAGRSADLTAYLDPAQLADSAVDLNLKLMKWRISPSLNLDAIKNTKCLLLGAGTLGSYVARNLLGWGVRKITFVDNAGVSFSNPVRQPLYRFEDCINGGRRKAERAAEALREIYPGVDATGYVMSVPMAGHPIVQGDAERTKGEFEKLEELIKEHDAVFQLMDSRESRWLPTVIGKAHGKIVLNAALGFDTYVVMRHGMKAQGQDGDGNGVEDKDGELGCYFCNDVVAPVDSMKDLTLDQQCTVTRPGVAAIASALLVEILVSVLQHPWGGAAPASKSANDDRGDHPLGLIPHQIRGFLSTFTNLNIVGKSYDCCSACSPKILNAYRTEGWSFVEKALNQPDYVEELSGLKEVQRLAEAAAADIEFSEEEEEEDGDGELI